ncbi:TonB-dependent receptor [Sphingomonas sp.]|uniref:TonB-dependent receptor n=1 Tax=Sphingomonas sp. TaxID=28214 RepID=UPI002EDA72F4
MREGVNLRRRMGATTSWSVLGLLLVCGTQALAQTSAEPGQSGDAVEDPAGVQDVLVVGSRASQQSANARKKGAKTATDSIVADDIGSFPDRNVAEAISRIPGVALGRNEFGEGADVAIRGNGPDLTRVELDGVGMTSTTGLALPNGNDSARSADLRELPADLVKSIDVVKGSTADMTEGSLGGTVQIKTRTGLDFAKPYFTLRAGANQNSLGKDWMPDFNGVASRKFFGGRLGAIVSGSYTKLQNNGHSYEQTTSNSLNYDRRFDFDNSPEKTFEYNINTLGTDMADIVFANSTETPRSVLTKSIAAKTKADCYAAFPQPGQAGSNAAKLQKLNELQSCLNQWNDYTPSLIRHFMNEQTDERYAFDARLDFEVADNFTVFVKGTYSGRNMHDQNRSRTPVSLLAANVAGTYQDTTTGYPRTRSLSPTSPAGYYLYDQASLVRIGNSDFLTNGATLNVDPSSVVVDDNHNVTEMTLTNNSVGIDQIENRIRSRTKFAQAGFDYNGDRLDIEGFVGMTEAESSRGDMRTARNSFYGDATLVLQDNGLWDIQLPSNYSDTDPNSFVQLNPVPCISGTNPATCIAQRAVTATVNNPASPDYTSNQLPLVTPGFSVSYSPSLAETSERLAKLDVTYKTEGLIPFITRVKAGGQYRKNVIDAWRGGGYTVKDAIGNYLLPNGALNPDYQPPIVVPTANVRGTLRACQPTATSTVSCNYGFVPSTNLSNIRSGVDTLTAEQLRALFAGTFEAPTSAYFGDLPNRGSLPPAWSGIRTDELFAQLGASQFMNFDCLKTCMGSDGKMYDQPKTHTEETVKAIYAMAEFEQRLPFGLLFNGNVGIRGVFTNIKGQGVQVLRSITVPDPSNPAVVNTQTFRQNVTLNASTTDWLPTVNLNLWGFNESVVLRLYGGKTVARPNIGRLMPAGECNIDERIILDGDGEDIFGCTGRVGYPGLKPFTAWNYNASLEWYPNKDTLLSVTYGKLDVQIGNPIAVTKQYRPFEGSDVVDPVTGQPLSDLTFNVPTWENGPGYQRSIWEFQAKSAFTFLPWLLRYTGADVNYSRLASAATTGQQDPLTGDIMPPAGESRDYWNASLWYDDGKLNIRVAYQKRSERFTCISPCSANGNGSNSNNYPGEQWTSIRLPYSPGVPRYLDGTTFIDAKISYNINRNFQVYLEGRNMTRESQITSTGGYEDFADGAPKIMRMSYGGRRIMGGVRIQFGGKK